ncbi:hypothetical protein M0R89_03480 [Halorussus limi]|uniref:Uncharacterized protein n=1 Tax=Halorussus limi TaxID=2938695 RepID=A0A8U0HW46_9EURY|nr:hypothetical protein [Halorussus limi]UPV75137.1 hypothetical protein M0R89_03480 [Halorussus limi]
MNDAMTDDDADALARVRRAKARQHSDRWLDGGAVAAGAVLALAPQVAPAFAFAVGVPDAVVTAFAAATLLAVPLGASVAGYLGGAGRDSGARHGAAAVAAATLGADATALLLAPDAVAAVLGDVSVPLALVGTTAAGAALGTLAGSVGGRRRKRDRATPRGGDPGESGRGRRDA